MNLPPKKEYLIHIPLTLLQKKLYKDGLDNNLHRSIVEVNLKEYLFYNHSSTFKYPRDEPEIDAYLQKAYDDQNLEERQKDYSSLKKKATTNLKARVHENPNQRRSEWQENKKSLMSASIR